MTLNSLYIHLPFCRSICAYCDFPKVLLLEKYIEPYIASLKREISELPKVPLKSIYIGGGTPLSLDIDILRDLFSHIQSSFDLADLREYSLETTPHEISFAKLALLREFKIDRLSIGVETLETGLPYLDRVTSRDLLLNVKNLLDEQNFTNYNFDMIYGWPQSSISAFLENLEFLIALNPTHLSLYPLAIEKGTRLYNQRIKAIPDDLYADYYEEALRLLHERGYERYEISNFALPGCSSLHNLTYWRGEEYLAAGLGASSFYQGHRRTRTRSLAKYIAGDYVAEDQYEDRAEIKNDFVMLNLRLDEGFALAEYQRRFQTDFLIEYKKEIAMVSESLIITAERVRVKREYLYILDSILTDLLK